MREKVSRLAGAVEELAKHGPMKPEAEKGIDEVRIQKPTQTRPRSGAFLSSLSPTFGTLPFMIILRFRSFLYIFCITMYRFWRRMVKRLIKDLNIIRILSVIGKLYYIGFWRGVKRNYFLFSVTKVFSRIIFYRWGIFFLSFRLSFDHF